MKTKTSAFAGASWVLEGFMKALKNELNEGCKAHILEAIKSFSVGGASTRAECIEWAKRLDLPVVLDLGRTEVGGTTILISLDIDTVLIF